MSTRARSTELQHPRCIHDRRGVSSRAWTSRTWRFNISEEIHASGAARSATGVGTPPQRIATDHNQSYVCWSPGTRATHGRGRRHVTSSSRRTAGPAGYRRARARAFHGQGRHHPERRAGRQRHLLSIVLEDVVIRRVGDVTTSRRHRRRVRHPGVRQLRDRQLRYPLRGRGHRKATDLPWSPITHTGRHLRTSSCAQWNGGAGIRPPGTRPAYGRWSPAVGPTTTTVSRAIIEDQSQPEFLSDPRLFGGMGVR
jgi:hypothetical protein